MKKKIEFVYWYNTKISTKRNYLDEKSPLDYEFYLIPTFGFKASIGEPDSPRLYLVIVRFLHLSFQTGIYLRDKFPSELTQPSKA